MKRISLLFLVIAFVALFFTGCSMLTPDIKDVQVKVTSIKQEVSCSGTKGIALNGELPKCGPYCPPPCPGCDSCCPNCPDCPECVECPECEQCQECPDIPECPTCPTCSPCCCALKWGDLVVDFNVWNTGDVKVIVEGAWFVITFDDGTTIKEYVDIGEILLIGEEKGKEVEINLPNPIKRVVLVEPETIEFN